MKVARLYSFQDIRIEDAAVPEVGPRYALMRTKACGICSGDVMPWYIEKKAPIVIGREPAGEIVAVGSEVTKYSPVKLISLTCKTPFRTLNPSKSKFLCLNKKGHRKER